MIDDDALERGLRARPPADPAYRSRITETPPTAIRSRLRGRRGAQPGRTRAMPVAIASVVVIAIAAFGAFLLSVGGGRATLVPGASPTPSRPAASPLSCGNHTGTWMFPRAAPDPATAAQTTTDVLGGIDHFAYKDTPLEEARTQFSVPVKEVPGPPSSAH